MNTSTHDCLERPRPLWDTRMCLHAVSKDVKGELRLLQRERQECPTDDDGDEGCTTLKADQLLRLEVSAHEPCDSRPSRALDGAFFVRHLVTAFEDGSGENRGLHTGDFEWIGGGVRVSGTMAGTTNVGTHREPAFDPCQECRAPGYMEGRLCGVVLKAEDERLRGCKVAASYRFRFDASGGAIDTEIAGTIEGAIACRCDRDRKCLDFRSFPTASHANPWTVSGCTFLVHDFRGSPTPTADVLTWGAHTGLNVNYETRVSLSAPADAVDLELVHFSQPATVDALDGGGAVVDTQTMTAAGGVPEALRLDGPGATIESIVIRAPQDETLLLELCTS